MNRYTDINSPIWDRPEWKMDICGAFCWVGLRRKCKICGSYLHTEDQTHHQRESWNKQFCESEWCERLYRFYHSGKPIKLEIDNSLPGDIKFNIYLADYIRRKSWRRKYNEIQTA